ncbi:MAG: hypothetical protein QOE70_2558 [Chthoniobacter sp.]|nr:hypothetical protein [Chthoniobacter sp.]
MRLGDFAWLAAAVLLFGLVLDLALSAARAFRSEISGQTLAGLALTRIEPGYLVRCKITRAVRAAWPTGVWLALAFGTWFAARYSEGLHSGHPNPFGPVILVIIGGLIAGAFLWPQALLIVKLTALLSLRMPHGAPLLAVGVVFAGNLVLAGILTLFNSVSLDSEALAIMAFLATGLTLFGLPVAALFLGPKLERRIVERLDQLIAED